MSSSSSSLLKVRSYDDRRRRSSAVEVETYEARRLKVPTSSADVHRARSVGRDERRGSTLEPPKEISRRRSLSTSRRVQGYVYTPLDRGVKRAIRTIRVLPDTEHGYISCRLKDATTDAQYSALSYTWGSDKDAQEAVLINGKPFKVRQNLFAFLRHARKHFADKPLWIDAICINQEDIEEKSRQVKMMWRVYTETREVLVWLGPKVDHVGHAIRCMDKYAEMNDAEMAISSARDDEFWDGFHAINTAMYWDRVWVIQEFTLPDKGRIICGDRWVTFATFQDTIRRFDSKIYRLVLNHLVFSSRRQSHFSDYISKIHPLWQRRLEHERSIKYKPSANWTVLSGTRYCQDLRDRVYGIMPLATHGTSLSVDYTITPLELLLESIWLEHSSDMDRTDVLMNLANILLLSPAAICLYADVVTSRAKYHLWKSSNLPRDRAEALRLHISAAASRRSEQAWLDVSSAGGEEVEWRNFAADQLLKMPKGFPAFPGRRQCPWQMFSYSVTKHGRFGLKLAIDAIGVVDESRGGERNRDRDGGRRVRGEERDRDRGGEYRGEDRMGATEFLESNRKKAMALGVYKTKCAPVPMTVYYALVDGLEGVGFSDNKAGAFEEALDGLNGLKDLDVDL